MFSWRCALLPLGSARGDDALNACEHMAFADWLDSHECPGDSRREERLRLDFDRELARWEAQEFHGPWEAMQLLDGPYSDDEFFIDEEDSDDDGF